MKYIIKSLIPKYEKEIEYECSDVFNSFAAKASGNAWVDENVI